jgi:hypothetical protein
MWKYCGMNGLGKKRVGFVLKKEAKNGEKSGKRSAGKVFFERNEARTKGQESAPKRIRGRRDASSQKTGDEAFAT